MANVFYDYWDSLTAPLVAFAYWLRQRIDYAVAWIIAIWPDHRPVHTMGYEDAHPSVEVAQRTRVAAFSRRRLERLPGGRTAFLTPRWAM